MHARYLTPFSSFLTDIGKKNLAVILGHTSCRIDPETCEDVLCRCGLALLTYQL